jgi:serine phosphatase RsbU (regulator of sigma subunit)
MLSDASRGSGIMRSFYRALWQAPLWAAPFALFFGTLGNGSPKGFAGAYEIALTFATIILTCNWALRSVAMPILRRVIPEWRPRVRMLVAAYFLTSMSGSLLAAMTVHLYVRPGFLGSLQAIVVWGMFSILFIGLILSLSLVRRYHGASVEQARMQKDLDVVREIQESFTPELPTNAALELHTVNLPSRTVSGDFVDVVRSDAGLLIAIADVEGKGVPAAVLMATIQASLRTQAQCANTVASMVRGVNRLLCRRGGVQRFASLVLARLDHDGERLTYCNAGHNPPVLIRRDGARLLFVEGGLLLGVSETADYQEAQMDLQPGDRLVFYTDGVVEAMNGEGEEFQLARLGDLIASLPSRLGASTITASITRAVNQFVGHVELQDDRTLLLLSVPDLPAQARVLAPRSERLCHAAHEFAHSS